MERRRAIGVLGSVAADPVLMPFRIFAELLAWSERVRVSSTGPHVSFLLTAARERFGADFADCEPEEQVRLAADLDAEVTLLREDPGASASRHFFHLVKRFTITAYFTSEVPMVIPERRSHRHGRRRAGGVRRLGGPHNPRLASASACPSRRTT